MSREGRTHTSQNEKSGMSCINHDDTDFLEPARLLSSSPDSHRLSALERTSGLSISTWAGFLELVRSRSVPDSGYRTRIWFFQKPDLKRRGNQVSNATGPAEIHLLVSENRQFEVPRPTSFHAPPPRHPPRPPSHVPTVRPFNYQRSARRDVA